MAREPSRPIDLAWSPPQYTVDAEGRVVGLTNDREPNNWGRWGPLDQKGTTNYIDSSNVVEAAHLIETGEVISCALPIDDRSPVHASRTPIVHLFSYSGTDIVAGAEVARRFPGYQGTDDYLLMPVQSTTQWDGLSHVGYEDALYNGFWIGNVEGRLGAKRCGIHLLHDTLVGRGVLLDLVGYLGVERLEPGFGIDPDLLEECREAQDVELRRGDIVLIRTGHLPWYYTLRDTRQFWRGGAPGLTLAAATWCHKNRLSAIAMDTAGIEVEPFDPAGDTIYPVHIALIRDLGMPLGELWWLEELAKACARIERYEFFLSAPPLRISNASGSMLNPVAVL